MRKTESSRKHLLRHRALGGLLLALGCGGEATETTARTTTGGETAESPPPEATSGGAGRSLCRAETWRARLADEAQLSCTMMEMASCEQWATGAARGSVMASNDSVTTELGLHEELVAVRETVAAEMASDPSWSPAGDCP